MLEREEGARVTSMDQMPEERVMAGFFTGTVGGAVSQERRKKLAEAAVRRAAKVVRMIHYASLWEAREQEKIKGLPRQLPVPGEQPQVIGEPVEVGEAVKSIRSTSNLREQTQKVPLGTAADSPSHLKPGRCWVASRAGNTPMFLGGKLRFQRGDGLLEAGATLRSKHSVAGAEVALPVLRQGVDLSHQGNQLLLDRVNGGVACGRKAGIGLLRIGWGGYEQSAGEAERGVEFIDRSGGVNSEVVLREAVAEEDSSLSRVSCFRGDGHLSIYRGGRLSARAG